jgi:hypothetical protein
MTPERLTKTRARTAKDSFLPLGSPNLAVDIVKFTAISFTFTYYLQIYKHLAPTVTASVV